MSVLAWIADHVLNLFIYGFNWISANMTLGGAGTVALVTGYVSANAVRIWWPTPSRRPRWARLLLAVSAPLAGAAEGLLRRLGRAEAEPSGSRGPEEGRDGRGRAAAGRGPRRGGLRPRRGGRAS